MQLGRLNVRAQSSVARGTSIGAARGRKPAAHHQDGATALAATAAPSGRAFGSGLPQVGAKLTRGSPAAVGGGVSVDHLVVQPVVRSNRSSHAAPDADAAHRRKVNVLFLGESNICRSVLASGIMQQLLHGSGLDGMVDCESMGTRDYSVGDSPHSAALSIAAEHNLKLLDGTQARVFDDNAHISHFDLILVLDKFTAADVLRQLTKSDLLSSNGRLCDKVRLLGEFHPALSQNTTEPGAQDIDDPLYGNVGGDEELHAVRGCYALLHDACQGLVLWLTQLREADMVDGTAAGTSNTSSNAAVLKARLRAELESMRAVEWLVPPMLSPPSPKPV
mmetsp:Transcript_36474/g.107716  ORF Transcript_36474/g.107716 Transcript_36474/m.107716 type:complete len:334 (-) Transcript_36474:21-1022(-)